MWKIYDDGNAYNPDTGERMFVAISVLKQGGGCGGHRQWVCDCGSEDTARHFVKGYVARLNRELIEEATENARRPVEENPA